MARFPGAVHVSVRPRLVSLLCKSANATRKKKAHPAFMIIHVCTDVRASAKKRAEHRLWRTKCPVAGAPENPGGAQASGKFLKKRKQNSERSGVQPTFAERPVCAGCSHAHASKTSDSTDRQPAKGGGLTTVQRPLPGCTGWLHWLAALAGCTSRRALDLVRKKLPQ